MTFRAEGGGGCSRTHAAGMRGGVAAKTLKMSLPTLSFTERINPDFGRTLCQAHFQRFCGGMGREPLVFLLGNATGPGRDP